MISHENQSVLLKIFFGTFVRLCNLGSANVARSIAVRRVKLKSRRFVLSELYGTFVLSLRM